MENIVENIVAAVMDAVLLKLCEGIKGAVWMAIEEHRRKCEETGWWYEKEFCSDCENVYYIEKDDGLHQEVYECCCDINCWTKYCELCDNEMCTCDLF